jgi:hypothetical protein
MLAKLRLARDPMCCEQYEVAKHWCFEKRPFIVSLEFNKKYFSEK